MYVPYYNVYNSDTTDKDRNEYGVGRNQVDRFGVVGPALDENQQRLFRHRFPQAIIHGSVGGIPSKVNENIFIIILLYYRL